MLGAEEGYPTILPIKLWQTEVEQLKEDDIVLVVDHTLLRNSWPKVIIDGTYPGRMVESVLPMYVLSKK